MQAHDVYVGDILLPVTPAAIETKIQNKNEVVHLLNGEDLNLLNKPGLTEFRLKALLPHEDFPSVGVFQPPEVILARLERYKLAEEEEERVFPFLIIRYVPGLTNSINKRVTLEEYTITEDTENGRDIVVELFLKQYIPLKTKRVEMPKASVASPVPAVKVSEVPKRPTPPAKVKGGKNMTASILARKVGVKPGLFAHRNGMKPTDLVEDRELYTRFAKP